MLDLYLNVYFKQLSLSEMYKKIFVPLVFPYRSPLSLVINSLIKIISR